MKPETAPITLASPDFVKGYERGYADAREAAAQEMATMYNDLCERQRIMVVDLAIGNKMIADMVLAVLAPVQDNIRSLRHG